MFTTLLNFCSNDLSSFYFDIRKDTIYCDQKNSIKRRSARTLLDILFNCLLRWLAPSLVFTCEEAWKANGNISSIHLEDFETISETFKNDVINKKWKIIKEVRKVVTGALEIKRAEKMIRSSLEASINVYVSSEIISNLKGFNLAEIAITSTANIIKANNRKGSFSIDEIKDVSVEVKKASGNKCARCWQVLDKVKNVGEICLRCKDAVIAKRLSTTRK
jgi:isoleucyl-tRNA synthetase